MQPTVSKVKTYIQYINLITSRSILKFFKVRLYRACSINIKMYNKDIQIV